MRESRKKKKRDPLPEEFSSPEEAGEFWFFMFEGVVEDITDNWVAIGEEVDADLVGASGDWLAREQGTAMKCLAHFFRVL